MRFPFFIAKRYLFSKKSHNAINWISGIATLGIIVGTAALILTLSVFNGLSNLLESLFGALDADIKIEAARGKFFDKNNTQIEALQALESVSHVTVSLEDRVVMQYYDQQTVVTLKGVDSTFTVDNPIDDPQFLWTGTYDFSKKAGVNQAVFGQGVAVQLAINTHDEVTPVSIKALSSNARSLTDLANAVQYGRVFPAGVFSVQKEYDDKYVLADLAYVQELIGKENQLTSIEVSVADGSDINEVAARIEAALGDDFRVLTWYDQHASLAQVMRNEKYVAYLILTLLIALAAINIVGSLAMIVLEKTRDVAVLKSMGCDARQIRQIFLGEGLLVGGIGVGVGMSVALIVGIFQQQWGIFGMGSGDYFRISALPFALAWQDFVLVFFTVMSFALLAAIYPARRAADIEITQSLAR